MVNLVCKGSYYVGNEQVLVSINPAIGAINNKIIKRGRKNSAPLKQHNYKNLNRLILQA